MLHRLYCYLLSLLSRSEPTIIAGIQPITIIVITNGVELAISLNDVSVISKYTIDDSNNHDSKNVARHASIILVDFIGFMFK